MLPSGVKRWKPASAPTESRHPVRHCHVEGASLSAVIQIYFVLYICDVIFQENRIYAIASVGMRIPDVSNGLNRGRCYYQVIDVTHTSINPY